MGRQAPHTYTLPNGRRVGYSLTSRPAGYRVRFVDPGGERRERATGCDTRGDARAAAEAIIAAAFAPPTAAPAAATWDDALADLAAAADLRPDSVRDYRTAVGAVRALFPDLPGPSAVTPAVAHAFPAKCLSTPYRRGKASDAARYKRSPTSVNSYLRSLRCCGAASGGAGRAGRWPGTCGPTCRS